MPSDQLNFLRGEESKLAAIVTANPNDQYSQEQLAKTRNKIEKLEAREADNT